MSKIHKKFVVPNDAPGIKAGEYTVEKLDEMNFSRQQCARLVVAKKAHWDVKTETELKIAAEKAKAEASAKTKG